MLNFEQWHVKEEGFLLPKVWFRVYGLRKSLREYLNLWAVGTMFGSTQIVDMKTTRKNDFGRILVAVLDPKLVPNDIDVVIGDHYFHLKLEEGIGFDENGDEAELDFDDGEDFHTEEQEDGDINHGTQGPVRDPKRSKGDDVLMEDSNSNLSADKGAAEHAEEGVVLLEGLVGGVSSEEAFVEFDVAPVALGEAAGRSVKPVQHVEAIPSDVVPAVEASSSIGADVALQVQAPAVGCPLAANASLQAERRCQVAPAFQNCTEPALLPVVACSDGQYSGPVGLARRVRGRLVCKQVAGRPENLAAAAAIKEAAVTPTRSSPRVGLSKDEHALSKAKKRAAWKNLDFGEGNLQSNILDSTLVTAT